MSLESAAEVISAPFDRVVTDRSEFHILGSTRSRRAASLRGLGGLTRFLRACWSLHYGAARDRARTPTDSSSARSRRDELNRTVWIPNVRAVSRFSFVSSIINV